MSPDIAIFYPLAAVVGLLGSVADPARQAMIADILPEEQRAEGFGMMRVIANLAWIIGPAIGGLVASYSFMMLFVLDTIASLLTALVVYRLVPETMAARARARSKRACCRPLAATGWWRPTVSSWPFSCRRCSSWRSTSSSTAPSRSICATCTASRPRALGCSSASTRPLVVLLQFWVTRRIKSRPPMLMMVVGTALYMVGFAMFGVVTGFAMFVLAAVIITVGEMITVPVSQALVAQLAPEDMRGRYMAVWGFGWAIPSAIGPLAAGLVMDNLNPNLVWYAGGVLCALGMVGYYLLHLKAAGRLNQSAATPGA